MRPLRVAPMLAVMTAPMGRDEAAQRRAALHMAAVIGLTVHRARVEQSPKLRDLQRAVRS
jgi:hypothetical protein